ncbi:Hypothetical protein CINCED_3A019316 [Cinara cedri]|uniref:DUF659 domain-containing protein n=1 Tax=Cinara cedri TaxID=506608 RepID=A0A5E4NM78_9HEMI|nr:Hypothetical protein CINCED_3A019316 [Cinara cedri]
MFKATKTLKIFFPKLIHITCMAHAVNRVLEKIRQLYSDINKLIDNRKKALLKAPSRMNKYRKEMPGTPLSSEPIITRWGTWLNAALFYTNNFGKFKNAIGSLTDDARVSKS